MKILVCFFVLIIGPLASAGQLSVRCAGNGFLLEVEGAILNPAAPLHLQTLKLNSVVMNGVRNTSPGPVYQNGFINLQYGFGETTARILVSKCDDRSEATGAADLVKDRQPFKLWCSCRLGN